MQNQEISFEQEIVDRLGRRIGILSQDLEITAVERDRFKRELDKAKNKIAELEGQISELKQPAEEQKTEENN